MSIAIGINGPYFADTGLPCMWPTLPADYCGGWEKCDLCFVEFEMKWPSFVRVWWRIEQCQRMIEAHKATYARMLRTDLLVWHRAYGEDLKDNARAHWKARKACPHVLSAMRYLGVRL